MWRPGSKPMRGQGPGGAKALADAAAKAQAEEAAHGRTPQLIIPLRVAPPAPETQASTGRDDDEQPVAESGGADAIILGPEVPPQALTPEAHGGQPDAPQVPPVGGELVVGETPVVRTPLHRRMVKATSVPRLQDRRPQMQRPLVPSH